MQQQSDQLTKTKHKEYKKFSKAMAVAKDDILNIKRAGANMFTSLDE